MRTSARLQGFLIAFLALTIGITTYLYLSTLNSRASSNGKNQSVYVAVTDISPGTSFSKMLQESLIQLRNFPMNSLNTNVISSKSSFPQSAVNENRISAGQLILSDMFSTPRKFVSGLNIPNGMLAISISVDEVSRVANFVVPGSKVVIFSTGADGKRGETATRLLTREALVLAIGNQLAAPAVGLQIASSSLVTLAVDPKTADLIVHASQTSKLNLALAHANNPNQVDLPNYLVTNTNIFGGN
jgi:Flp pilus assembly protein CpaB